MIFNVPGHIEMIKNGIKTQTRRVTRGCYQEGRDYAIQRKRGAKGEENIRIVMEEIWEENLLTSVGASDGLPINPYISYFDAQVEGNYTPEEYELEFKKCYPKWDGKRRCVFEFHLKGIKK